MDKLKRYSVYAWWLLLGIIGGINGEYIGELLISWLLKIEPLELWFYGSIPGLIGGIYGSRRYKAFGALLGGVIFGFISVIIYVLYRLIKFGMTANL